MTAQTYYYMMEAFLIASGLFGILYVPRMIRRRVDVGDFPPSHLKIGTFVRVMGFVLVIMGLALIVLEFVKPLKRG